MNWNAEDNREVSALRLGAILGLLSAGVGAGASLLFKAEPATVALIAGVAGLGVGGGVIGLWTADMLWTAITASRLKRARMRAARTIYQAWSEIPPQPSATVRTATVHSSAGTGKLSWLEDDQPAVKEWRQMLIEMLTWARDIWQSSGGERTGLTEIDLTGPGLMFAGSRAYAKAVKQLVQIGIATRQNGMATCLAEGWTYGKGIAYLQTAAPLAEVPTVVPAYRRLPSRGYTATLDKKARTPTPVDPRSA